MARLDYANEYKHSMSLGGGLRADGAAAELFYEIARKLPKAQPAAPIPGGIILNNNQAPKAPKKSSCC